MSLCLCSVKGERVYTALSAVCHCCQMSLCLCSVKGERVYTALSAVWHCCQMNQTLLKAVAMLPDDSDIDEGCCYVAR